MHQAHFTPVVPTDKSLSADVRTADDGRFYPALQIVVGVLILGSGHALYELTVPFSLLTIAMGLAVGVSGLRQLLKH